MICIQFQVTKNNPHKTNPFFSTLGGICGVTVIVMANESNESISNPGRGCFVQNPMGNI